MVYYYRPQNLHYDRAKCCITRPNPCIYWYSGYSPKMHHYSPKWCIIPQMVCYSPKRRIIHAKRRIINAPQNLHYCHAKTCITLLNLVFTCIQAIPKCTIIFSKGVLSPQKVCYCRAKWCVTLLNPCIYWYSGYSPEWCVITTQNVALLSRTLVFTGVQATPQMSYYSRKMTCYQRPQNLCYSRKKVCYY